MNSIPGADAAKTYGCVGKEIICSLCYYRNNNKECGYTEEDDRYRFNIIKMWEDQRFIYCEEFIFDKEKLDKIIYAGQIEPQRQEDAEIKEIKVRNSKIRICKSKPEIKLEPIPEPKYKKHKMIYKDLDSSKIHEDLGPIDFNPKLGDIICADGNGNPIVVTTDEIPGDWIQIGVVTSTTNDYVTVTTGQKEVVHHERQRVPRIS